MLQPKYIETSINRPQCNPRFKFCTNICIIWKFYLSNANIFLFQILKKNNLSKDVQITQYSLHFIFLYFDFFILFFFFFLQFLKIILYFQLLYRQHHWYLVKIHMFWDTYWIIIAIMMAWKTSCREICHLKVAGNFLRKVQNGEGDVRVRILDGYTTFNNISVISWLSILYFWRKQSTRRKSPIFYRSLIMLYHIMYDVAFIWRSMIG